MDLETVEVCFPRAVADKILARGTSEEEVYAALTADPGRGAPTPP